MNLNLTITGDAKCRFSWHFDWGSKRMARGPRYSNLTDLRREIIGFIVAVQSDDFEVHDETTGALLKLEKDKKLEDEVGKPVARRETAQRTATTRRTRPYV